MNLKTWLLILSLSLLVFSCKKTEVNTVTGNQAPSDESISELQVSTYITRLYITILGRKASDAEFADARALLSNPKDTAKRGELINSLLGQYESKRYYVDRIKQDLIEGVDSATIQRDIMQINLLLQDTSLNPIIRPEYEKILVKLEDLQELYNDYTSSNKDWIGVIKTCLDNNFYDQINMGAENFVVSMFQHFLDRYPSNSELSDGKKMLNGENASLFLQSGSSKNEFIDIFLASESFLEGRIHRLFESYLFRKATQDEVIYLTNFYLKTSSYEALQRHILISDEYFKK